MATRLIIFDSNGSALFALDGHHGTEHAQIWLDQCRALLQQRQIENFVLEVVPERGGDECRRDAIGQIHRLRCQLHETPTGSREVVGVYQHGQRGVLGMSEEVRGGRRVVAADASLKLPVQSLRQRRGRQSVTPNPRRSYP